MKQKNIVFLSIVLFCLLTTIRTNAQQWGLYTLYAPVNSTQTYLIDTNGTTYKTWTHLSTKKTGFSVYLTPGDTLIHPVALSGNSLTGGGMTGAVQKITWNGTVVWDFTYSSSTYCLHHDVHPMPNGNVLMTCYEVKSATDATNAGCSSSITIWSEKLIEVHPTGATTGTIVWEWHLWDHLCQNYNSTKPNYVTSISQHPELMNINYLTAKDWIHMNGIDYNEALDQITFSSRTMNEIYVIDHSTTTAEAATHSGGNSGKGGDFLYRWGNPLAYGVSGTKVFTVVHDAHWISADNPTYPNYLCGFNNGGGIGGKSCVDIINPPYNGFNYSYTPGSSFLPATYSYRHTSTYTTNTNGASHQLPNGNILICMSDDNYLYEINPAGTTLWSKTLTGSPANALRYEMCYVRGPVALATASVSNVCVGTPFNLSSTATSVTETSPTYTYSWSSSPSGFSSSLQNPSITSSSAGINTYVVTITNTALGCWDTASVRVVVNACTGMDESVENNSELKVFPNPTNGIIYLDDNFTNRNNFEICVSNSIGQSVFQGRNIKTVDLSELCNGIYNVTIKLDNSNVINKKVILMK
jgi:hypothetical protein